MLLNQDDATHTFRGFRLQTLYIVYKILSHEQNFQFQPEGAEDLAIYDENSNLIEVVQVKSSSSNFNLSNLKNTFFERSIDRQKSFPDLKLSLVMFGTFGLELYQALKNDGRERQKVIEKLLQRESFICTSEELDRLFNSIEAIAVSEEEVKADIVEKLYGTFTGIDTEVAFDLLSMWVYYSSEEQLIIDQASLIEKITSIGRYLNGRKNFHDQFFTTIEPIENNITTQLDVEQLAESYYQGESAHFLHVLAGLDVVRYEKLQKIHQLFLDKNVLFIYGVSGQGKSTLAYRYLYDYYPDTWRFQVKSIESRKDALKSAQALSEHTNALKVPIIVFLDVSASDKGWEELVKELSYDPNIRLLITLREEDWKRSKVSGVEFSFNEIELKFDEVEAEQIYDVLFERELVTKHINFDESWQEFSGDGPLLEYVYLLTQGGRLIERLRSQLNQLIDDPELNDDTLNVLRAVAIATASGAQLDVRTVINHFKNLVPEKTFKRLEAEYLLRLDVSKQRISAVHPIRSQLLEKLFFEYGLVSWIDEARTALPLLYKESVGQFLLHSLLTRFDQRYELLDVIYEFKPKTWEAAEGVLRALIWLNVRDFIEDKKGYIKEVFNTREGNFVFMLAGNIVNIGSGIMDDVFTLQFIPEDRRNRCMDIYNNLGTKDFRFDILSNWLENHLSHLSNPTSNSSWSAFASICLWRWKCQLEFMQSLSIEWNDVDYNETLSLDTIGRVSTALYLVDQKSFEMWKNLYRGPALESLQSEEDVFFIDILDESVKAYFISLDMRKTEELSSDSKINVFHEKTMRVIDHLRYIFPEKNTYSTQGYGHILFDFVSHDDSIKNIPKDNLPLQDFVSVNAMFRRMIYNLFRPSEWSEYIEKVIGVRYEIVDFINNTSALINQYFQSKTPFDPLRKSGKIDEWIHLEDNSLKDKYLLPSFIVDPYGFTDGDVSSNKSNENSIKTFSLAMVRYSEIQSSIRKYLTDLGTFIDQASAVFDINAVIGKFSLKEQITLKEHLTKRGINIEPVRLSTINLESAISTLPLLQKEFYKLFAHFVDKKDLVKLDNLENRSFQKLALLWYSFTKNSNVVTKNADKEFTNRFEERKKQTLIKFIEFLNNNELEAKYTVFIDGYKNDYKSILYIGVTHTSAVSAAYAALNSVIITDHFMKTQTEFAKSVMDYYWSYIYFVPEYQEYSINKFCMSYDINYAINSNLDEEISPARLIPKDLTNVELTKLGLMTNDSELHNMVVLLQTSAAKLMTYLLNLKEFKKVEESDAEDNENILQNYAEELGKVTSKELQNSIDQMGFLLDAFKEFEVIDLDRYSELVNTLSDFYKALKPSEEFDSSVSLTFTQIDSWATKLNENMQLIIFVMIPTVLELEIKNIS